MSKEQTTINHNPVVKIGPKHQVTIPQNFFKRFNLQPGDFLEAEARENYIVMYPKQLVAKSPLPRLTKKEKGLTPLVRDKVRKIQTDIINSKGLTDSEAKLAAKLGLIDEDQAWWWKEYWQEGEREAERDMKEGRISGPFHTVEELMEHLEQE